MRRFSVVAAAAFAMVGVAMNAHGAPTLTFTVSPGTASCGSGGLATGPSAPFSGEIDSDTAGTTKIKDLGLGCLCFGGGAATVVACGAIPDGSTSTLDVATGPQINACASAKAKAAAGKAKCLLGLESGESKKGLTGDPAKFQKCRDKESSSFAKAELKPPCVTNGDAAAIEAKIDAFVDDVVGEIVGTTNDPPVLSGCDAAELKAAGAKASCLLKLQSGALKKGVAADPLKVQKCKDKLSSSFAKAELKPPCSNAGLAVQIENKVDAFVDDVVGELSPNLVGSAGPNSDSCLVGAGPLTHCINNNSMPACANDGACGGASGSCALDANCNFGPPLPIVSPPPFAALTTCVMNVVQSTASGSGDSTLGTSTISLPLSSRVYITGNTASPCPKCLGGVCDPSWKTNTATTSPDTNAACTPVGSKMTTNDCRPSLPGFQAPLPVSLSPLTTGSTSKTDSGGIFCPSQGNAGAFGQGATQRIAETGSPAGDLSDNGPHNSHLVSVFCIPATGNAAVDGVADLPGPGAFSLNGSAQLNP